MKKLTPLVLLLLLGIAVISQDTIRHEIPVEQKENIFSIFTYLATLLAGWFIGIFGKPKQKDNGVR